MNTLKKMLILMLCLTLLTPMALASEYLTARLEGGALRISWPTNVGESCTLTIYGNGWPLAVSSVRGSDGGAVIALGDAPGRITVRLQTPGGTLACDAEGSPAATRQPASAKQPVATRQPVSTKQPVTTKQPTATKAPQAVRTPSPTATPRPDGASRPGLAGQVIAQVNQERAKQGLNPLREDGELNRAAAVRAREIVAKFSHTRPDGSSWSTVSASAFGENIARGQKTADKVMAAWLTSSGHRANILRPSFGSIGVCAYISGGVTYWVQLFGR